MYETKLQEKNRQELVWVFLIPAVVVLIVLSAQANSRHDLHSMPFLVGAVIGCVIYASVFTKEKWRRYFPDVLLAFAVGFAGLGALFTMNAYVIEKPFDNPGIIGAVTVITMCVLYLISIKRRGFPTPPKTGSKS